MHKHKGCFEERTMLCECAHIKYMYMYVGITNTMCCRNSEWNLLIKQGVLGDISPPPQQIVRYCDEYVDILSIAV